MHTLGIVPYNQLFCLDIAQKLSNEYAAYSFPDIILFV